MAEGRFLRCPDDSFLTEPCLVESLGQPIPNIKDQLPISQHARDQSSGFAGAVAGVVSRLHHFGGPVCRKASVDNYEAIFARATSHVEHMEDMTLTGEDGDEEDDESSSAGLVTGFETADGNPKSLCTESQLTFVVPPDTPPFYIRFRLEVNGKKERWQNPLTSGDDYIIFSPRLRGPMGNKCLPPPVLLSAEWEKANVEGKWAWQEQITHPQEGELRLFTLAGLLPSVQTSGLSGWLVGKAGQGLYGIRFAELQFADARYFAYEDLEESSWLMLGTLRYRLPSVDVGTAALTLALNWGRCIGVQRMQETLVSELGRKNRKANMRMIHDFALDTYERLVPVWHSSVEPWLAQNPTLAILVAERRSQMIRTRVVEYMQILTHRGLIKGIPPVLLPLRPTLLGLKCFIHGKPVDSSGWVEIPEGEAFTLKAEATPTNRTGSGPKDLTLWWIVVQSNEPGLDVAALLGPSQSMLPGTGGKLRLEFPVVSNDAATSDLLCPGRNRWGNPLVEAGTEFMVRVVAEEPRAHEDDFKDVRVRIVQHKRSAEPRSQRSLHSPVQRPQDPEAPFRRTPPRIWGYVKPGAMVAADFRVKLERSESVQDAAEAVLRELGFSPTKADIADVTSALADAEGFDDSADRFCKWYQESVFGKTLLSEGWAQFKDQLRERRNNFLANTLEIPRDRWGFKDDEWGGVIPETGLMQKHLACLTKHHLASIWHSRDNVKQDEAPALTDDKSLEKQPSERTVPQAVQLDVPESIDEATMLAVTEMLISGMGKQYMSKLLPSNFTEDERKKWVHMSAAEHSIVSAVEQLLTYRLAEYYAYTLSEETAAARIARDCAAAARQAEAEVWLESWRQNGLDASWQAENVPPASEAAKVVLKTAIKQEVERFMQLQLVPIVEKQLREHIVPACASTVKSMAWEFVQKRWLACCCGGAYLGTLAAGLVIGPWVAVFYLFKKQQALRPP